MDKTISTWECRLPCSLPCSAGSCTYHNYHLQREALEKHEWLVSTSDAHTPLYNITGSGMEGNDSKGAVNCMLVLVVTRVAASLAAPLPSKHSSVQHYQHYQGVAWRVMTAKRVKCMLEKVVRRVAAS